MDNVTKIFSAIDDAINEFQGSIPGIQAIIHNELQPLIKRIDIKNGIITPSVTNMRILGEIKNKLQKVIVNANYKESVNKFIESFGLISNLNLQYFSKFNNNYQPGATLGIVRELAIETTINDLIGQGMKVGVIDPIVSILNQNITTGGSYAVFQEELRNHILTTPDSGDGALVRYTKQITTDAIHQFNAQYSDAIAQDLNFNWGRYIGSLLTTSREFCVRLVAKEFVHRSELPAIIAGVIDGVQLKLSKTTHLPLGMIPGTNENNFKIRRGGYLCGHQFFWIPDNVVPTNLRIKFGKDPVLPIKPADPIEPVKPIKPAKVPKVKKPVEPKPQPAPINANPLDDPRFKPLHPGENYKQIRDNNLFNITSIEDEGYNIWPQLIDLLPTRVPTPFKLERASNSDAFFNYLSNKIVIGEQGKRKESAYFKKYLMAHELGHAIHNNNRIIRGGIVRDDFAKHFKELQKIIKGKGSEIENVLLAEYNKQDRNGREQIMLMYDVLGSLTKGRYGGGHSKSYYKTAGKPEAEVFAHSVTSLLIKNDFENLDPDMKKVLDLLREKIVIWLEEAARNA